MAVIRRPSGRRCDGASPGPLAVLAAHIRRALAQAAPPRRAAAATARPAPPDPAAGLQALMAAALALPGLAPAAEGDQVDFQYSHYEEGHRQATTVDYLDLPNGNAYINKPYRYFNPIQVDSLHGGARMWLADRVRFGFNYNQDTWGGATPLATAPAGFGNAVLVKHTVAGASPLLQTPGGIWFDRQLRPLRLVSTTRGVDKYAPETQLTHILSTASPETRKQGDFRLGYEWDEAALEAGGGLSVENDYESRFVNLGGRFDFNRKLTTLNLGFSYTGSDTRAHLDPAAFAYSHRYSVRDLLEETTLRFEALDGEKQTTRVDLAGERRDWAGSLSLNQVLSKSAVVEAGIGYTRSLGYLGNPYKFVATYFVDLEQQPAPGYPGGILTTDGNFHSFVERRPAERNQWTADLRYVQHIALLDAALHLGYRFFRDDWGIEAHTFEADWAQPLGAGWTLTPRVRYYSQEAADFYHPYLVVPHAYVSSTGTKAQRRRAEDRNLARLPAAFSSDHRLSGFGALSGGVTLSKRFSRGVTLEAGFEYYSHAGRLKLGGGGEGDYADFGYYVANAALKVDLSAPGRPGDDGPHRHHHAHGAPVPPGVMFAHMLDEPDSFMAGYRYMYGRQAGGMLHGSAAAGDRQTVEGGCPPLRYGCFHSLRYMDMHMHMLDLMYAPTGWLNLMLMPQFVDMEMGMSEPLRERAKGEILLSSHGHISSYHATGGIGDTGVYALARLFDTGGQRLHATVGVSAPTGRVNLRMPRPTLDYTTIRRPDGKPIAVPVPEKLYDYGMQLGSGTWDFKPSLTYTGSLGDWNWGAQVAATLRMEERNDSGYRLGDLLLATAWTGYRLLPWLALSARGVYTTQSPLRHRFTDLTEQLSPANFPANYGGRYWDAGFGLNLTVPDGAFQGNRIGVEWLQPLHDDVNGYQLQRQGSLYATWSMPF